jgi:hypothetical protein
MSRISLFWKMIFPRRRRNVLAETESIHVGHRDRQAAVAAAEIGKQVLQPVEQVLSPGIQRGFEDPRVGCDEVRGRDGVDELTRVGIDLASRGLIHALDVPDGRKNRLPREAGRKDRGAKACDQVTKPPAKGHTKKSQEPICERGTDDSENDVHEDSGPTFHNHLGEATRQAANDDCGDPSDLCFRHLR